MRKSILACVALSAAFVLALSTGAWADVTPGQDIGQLANSEQSASSSATSTQTNPSNTAVSVNILSPYASSGNVSQSNSSSATSSAGNTNGTTQNAAQQAGCCGGGSGVQGIGQAAGNGQEAASSATSTQTNPSNTAVSVNILSPGAHSGNVSQSNDSSATSSAGNTNGTTQNAGQQAGCCGSGGGVQGIGQQAGNYQQAESEAVSTQVDPSNHAITLNILSPGAGGGNVSQSNSSSATSSAGNTNGTTQNAAQQAGCSLCAASVPVCTVAGCPSHDLGAIQGIGQLAHSEQGAGSEATSTQSGATNVAASGAIGGSKPHDDALTTLTPVMAPGNVSQSNSSSATSSAGNTNGTTQNASQQGGWGAIQGIGQAAWNAQQAISSATSTQYCPANFVFGSFGNVAQSNASYALSGAGNTNGTTQNAAQA
jgi:hypothetical protein